MFGETGALGRHARATEQEYPTTGATRKSSPAATSLTLRGLDRGRGDEGSGTCSGSASCSGSSTSRPPRSATPARRSTPSTSIPCRTATPAPTCSSPSPRPATRSARPPAAGPTPTWRPAMAAFSRGALLGARGNSGVILSQMLGAIAGRIARAGSRRPHRPGLRRGDGGGHRRQLRRGRHARRGHHPQRRPRRQRRLPGRRRRSPTTGSATSSRPAPTAPARRSSAPPTSCRRSATLASSTPAVAGLCVILDAAETALTGRRPVVPPDPAHPGADRRPTTSRRTARPTR